MELSSCNYEKIYKHYEECFETHGDNFKGVDWPNYKDVNKRYYKMLGIIDTQKRSTILDFGCGCGHLYEFLQKRNSDIQYEGLDISLKFYDLCIKKFPNVKFHHLDVLNTTTSSLPQYDYILFNGVFTEKRDLTDDEMWDFFTQVIKKMWAHAKEGIAFNIMCPIVDYKDPKLYYLSYDKLGKFLKENLTRNYVINNNYGLWEYTVYVYRDIC